MTFPSHVPIAILGAGLSGLSCGLALASRAAFWICERATHPGGHASTREDNGYRFDRTGHLLHLRSPSLREEVLSWLGGDCVSIERRSVVFSHGVYTRYPFQANTFGLPKQVAYECLLGYLNTLALDKNRPVQNFAEYCELHFGAGFCEHFMLPYNQKLWGVPASEISASWCERFVPKPKLEDVLKGALGLEDPKLGYNAEFLYPRLGIGALADAMARKLPPIAFETAPSRIHARARELSFGERRVRYDVLVSSAPLPDLLRCIDELPPEVAAACDKLRATHLNYLDVALDCPAKKDFHWAYVPEAKYPFYRVGCYTHFSSALAPPNKASLYVELTSREPAPLREVLSRVLPGLIEMGVINSADDIAFARLRRLDHAYVIYDRNYDAALEVIRPFLDSMRIISCGRYGAWNYSSMEDALLFGRDAAARALTLLG
ncbi:MAG: protoporphyrinogen/coproporphyrinogen oxidase [Myxococcota bacterium]